MTNALLEPLLVELETFDKLTAELRYLAGKLQLLCHEDHQSELARIVEALGSTIGQLSNCSRDLYSSSVVGHLNEDLNLLLDFALRRMNDRDIFASKNRHISLRELIEVALAQGWCYQNECTTCGALVFRTALRGIPDVAIVSGLRELAEDWFASHAEIFQFIVSDLVDSNTEFRLLEILLRGTPAGRRLLSDE